MLVRKSLTLKNTQKLFTAITLVGGGATYLNARQTRSSTTDSAFGSPLNFFSQALSLVSASSLAHCDSGAGDNNKRVYIGLSVRSMMDQPGMMVLLVNTESPAWQGDMKVGDILLEIDGRPINVIGDLHEAVDNAHGKTLAFKVNRKGVELLCYVPFTQNQQ